MSARHLGTSEPEWLKPRLLDRLDPVVWGRPSRVVVVAPHPDDEVLGVGGSLRQLEHRGARIEVVSVTDGEASHPDSTRLSRAELGHRRRAETTEALRRLGIDAAVRHLGVPDGQVTAHERDLSAHLEELLDPDTLCLATWAGDGHPDHDATGRAALDASRRAGARLLMYPIWMWHWAKPGAVDSVPWGNARRADLGEASRSAKASAIDAFDSQIRPLGPDAPDQPVLPEAVLQRFRRPFEVVFVTRADTAETRSTRVGYISAMPGAGPS